MAQLIVGTLRIDEFAKAKAECAHVVDALGEAFRAGRFAGLDKDSPPVDHNIPITVSAGLPQLTSAASPERT